MGKARLVEKERLKRGQDLEEWWPLLPTGGVMAGSTYLSDPGRKIGVRTAVVIFAIGCLLALALALHPFFISQYAFLVTGSSFWGLWAMGFLPSRAFRWYVADVARCRGASGRGGSGGEGYSRLRYGDVGTIELGTMTTRLLRDGTHDPAQLRACCACALCSAAILWLLFFVLWWAAQ